LDTPSYEHKSIKSRFQENISHQQPVVKLSSTVADTRVCSLQ